MDAGELFPPEPIAGRNRHAAVGGGAHVDGPVGHPRQGFQAVLEGPVGPLQHHVDARGEGLGVDGGHEDRARPRVGIGDAPERPDPDGRPQAGLEQQLAHVVAAEPGGMPPRERGEPDRDAAAALLLVPAEGDDDGPEAAALSAMDRIDGAGGRRREPDAGPLLVLEQQLAAADVVALGDVHGGPEADVVVAQQRHPPRRPGGADGLVGLSRDRQPQSLANGVSPHLRHQQYGISRETRARASRTPGAGSKRLFHATTSSSTGGRSGSGAGAGPGREVCEVFLKLPRQAEATVRRATRIQRAPAQ